MAKKDNKEEDVPKVIINWDSGVYRKLSVTIDISGFKKIYLAYFKKKQERSINYRWMIKI